MATKTSAHPIEAEIAKALSLSRKPRESVKRWLARLVKGANDMEDTDFESLSDGAQEWVNAAIEATREKTDLPEFPDVDDDSDDDENGNDDADEEDEDEDGGEEEDEDEDEDGNDEEEEEPAPRRGRGRTSSKGKGRTSKGKGRASSKDKDSGGNDEAPKKSGGRTGSLVKMMRKYILTGLVKKGAAPKPEAVVAFLEKKGQSSHASTITTILYHSRATVAVLKEMGELGGDED